MLKPQTTPTSPSGNHCACGIATFWTLAFACIAGAQNPIVQTRYTADPAPLVHNGTVYLYTSHDEDGSTWFTMKDWLLYSSKDMVNWTDHGSPASLETFAWAKDNAWAVQAIERDGKFYLYVPVEQNQGGMAIGVAVADNPVGPFKDPLGKPLVAHGWGDIDPTVFIDDNGQAYLAWGNPTYKWARLNKDMISIDTSVGENGVFLGEMTVEAFGKRSKDDRPSGYEEASWLYKRNGLYYNIHAGGPVPEHLAYTTAESPEGPWKYGGVVMPTQGGSFTNHAGVIDFKGRTYLFYHNGALPGGGGFTRSVCVDELKFNEDGSIVQMDMTEAGVAPVAALDPYVRNEAETIAWTGGVETEPSSQGGMDVHDIDDGDYIKVRNVDFGAGAGAFMASVSSETRAKASKSSCIELRLDRVDGPLIGTVPVSYTGGAWKKEMTNITGATGVHDLFFVFKGEPTGDLFKFDHWQFAKKGAAKLVGLNASVDRYKIDTASGANEAQLHVAAVFADGTSKDVTAAAKVESGAPGIVAVKSGGIIGTKLGATTLTVSHGGKTDTVDLIVKDLATEVTVREISADVSNIELISGSRQRVVVTATYEDGHREVVTGRATFEVADQKIASVANGVVTAQGQGTTTVTVSFKGDLGEAATARIEVVGKTRDPFVRNAASDFNEQQGLSLEGNSEGGRNLCDATDGEWVKYNGLDFGTGAKALELRVATDTQGGTIEVRLESLDGPLVGSCAVEGTGGWQNWVTRTCEVKGATGVRDVYLKFTGGGGILVNLGWWKFVR